MSRSEKLLQQCRQNRKNVGLPDAIKLAEYHGFTHRAGGKHPHIMKRKGFRGILNFQETRDGLVPSYQVDQLLAAIETVRSTESDPDQ